MPDSNNEAALLEEKLNFLRHEYVLAIDPSSKFSIKVRIKEIQEEIRSLNEVAYRDTQTNAHEWKIQPVSRKLLKQSVDFNWWQRLTFRWQPLQELHRAALKATGVFEHNQINHYLSNSEGNMPIPFRTANGKTGGNTVEHLVNCLGEVNDKQRFYLLLGESGSGKSNVLFIVFYRLALLPKPSVLLLPISDALDLDQLSLPDQEQTVLLLDGIDEHPEALSDPNGYFARLETAARNFQKVIITCRTQFFVREMAERTSTATVPSNPYNRLYLEPIEAAERTKWIGRHPTLHPLSQSENFRTASAIMEAGHELFDHPLPLAFLEELIARKQELVFYRTGNPGGHVTAYEVYETAIKSWIIREAGKLPAAAERPAFQNRLSRGMLELAKWFLQREVRELAPILNFRDFEVLSEVTKLDTDELRVKSLLHRDKAGNYRFAHRTFKEYCYAILLFHGEVSAATFPFNRYTDTRRFLHEMAAVEYQRAQREVSKGNSSVPVYVNIQHNENSRPALVFQRSAGVSETLPLYLGYGQLTGIDKLREPLRNAFYALANRFLSVRNGWLAPEETQQVATNYGVTVGELTAPFFFRDLGPVGFAFLHPSFSDFFALHELLALSTEAEMREEAANFSFESLRCPELFGPEIAWLSVLASAEAWPSIVFDYEMEREELEKHRAETGSYFAAYSQLATVRPQHYQRFLSVTRRENPISLTCRAEDEGVMLPQLLMNFPQRERIVGLDLSFYAGSTSLDLRSFPNLSRLVLRGLSAETIATFRWPTNLGELVVDALVRETLIAKQPTLKPLLSPFPESTLTGQQLPTQPEMVAVAGGTFWMGDDASEHKDEKPAHLVEVSDFAMGKYPVTVREFAAFVTATNYRTEAELAGWAIGIFRKNVGMQTITTGKVIVGASWREDCYGLPFDQRRFTTPVTYLTWSDARAYCSWLSKETGQHYRLPREAEWEYAAIGGQLSNERDEDGHVLRQFTYAGSNELEEVGWYVDNILPLNWQEFGAQPVGQLPSNQLNIHDMSGNVWEWCEDDYDDEVYKARAREIVKDPLVSEDLPYRVLRGGSWIGSARHCRLAFRGFYHPEFRYDSGGFRLVLAPVRAGE